MWGTGGGDARWCCAAEPPKCSFATHSPCRAGLLPFSSGGADGGRCMQAELIHRLLAQLELLYLAGHRQRELGAHDDVARDLVVRDPPATVLAQRLRLEPDAL